MPTCTHCGEQILQPQGNVTWVHAEGGTIPCLADTTATPEADA